VVAQAPRDDGERVGQVEAEQGSPVWWGDGVAARRRFTAAAGSDGRRRASMGPVERGSDEE
jgi:hypothetical protein